MSKKLKSVTQRGVIYGEIIEATIKDAVAHESGEAFKVYSFKIKEKDSGVLVTCDKMRFFGKEESDGMIKYMNSLVDLVNQVQATTEETRIKCRINIYPQSDKNVIKQYTFLTTDITDEGDVYFKVSTTPKALTEAKDLETYETGVSSVTSTMPLQDVDFDNLNLKFVFLPEKGKEKILLTTLPEEYSEHIGKYQTGVGYEVKVKFKKGVKRQVEDGTFEFDTTEKKDSYTPNQLIIVASAPVENLEGCSDVDNDVF